MRFIYIIVSPLADKASRAAASSPTRNVSTGARIFIKIYFDFMSLLFRSFFLFRVFRSRRVQCQKCQAVFLVQLLLLLWLLLLSSRFWHATCTSLLPAPKIVGNLLGILSSLFSCSLSLSRSLCLVMWILIVLFECHYVCKHWDRRRYCLLFF